MAVTEFRLVVGVVEIDDDVGGIEQHDQVLREVSNGVDAQLPVAEQHRARFGNGEDGADDGEIDIGEILWRADAGDIAIASDLRYGRADDLGVGDLLADRRDGKPLEGSDGRLRLIIPDEKRYARWVRQIVSLQIRSANE